MINLMKKNVFFGVAFPLLLSAGICAGVFLPLSRSMGTKYLEYLKTNSALESARRMADSAAREPGKAIASLRDAGEAVDELTGLASSLGVEFASLSRGEPLKELGYAVVPVNLEIQAPYKKLGMFLGGLRSLEKSCVVISSLDGGYAGPDTLKMKAKVALKMYLLGDDESPTAAMPAQPKRSAQAQKSSYAFWGRNPYFLPNEHGASLEDLHLEGILTDKKGVMAVIDGEMVSKGEKIKGNTLVDIKDDMVILNDGKKDFILRLAQ